MCNILFLGGVFDDNGGRQSSYIRKLTANLQDHLGNTWEIINGGFYNDLQKVIESKINSFSYIFWFCDIPNDKPKLVKNIYEANPNIILIISKNNKLNKYSIEELKDRINKANASYLIEFKSEENGTINATLLNKKGDILFSKEKEIAKVGTLIINHIF